MCPITINKALLLQEGILKFELSWTAVIPLVIGVIKMKKKLAITAPTIIVIVK